ncbi:unnamed protein product [Knipowitschia caucasica]
MSPSWLLVAMVVGGATGAVSQCWDHPSCRDLELDSDLEECLQLCRSDLSAETPVIPGPAHLQTQSISLSDPAPLLDDSALFLDDSASQAKRSYSMEHFRWGKPVGRKRRPVKVYTNGVEEDSAEVFPGEIRRSVAAEAGPKAEGAGLNAVLQQKKNSPYKMKHFRWSGPPEAKRYGGFMKSWDERDQKPLLTLFKNVISKNTQLEG